MIKMKVINDEKQHFVIELHRPGRVEVTVNNGKVLAHVYEGAETNLEQELLGVYDGTLLYNKDWES